MSAHKQKRRYNSPDLEKGGSMSNPADAVQKVWGEILPLNKIVEMGNSK
jgi:hypothetical protein